MGFTSWVGWMFFFRGSEFEEGLEILGYIWVRVMFLLLWKLVNSDEIMFGFNIVFRIKNLSGFDFFFWDEILNGI